MKRISIICPFFNEQETVAEFFKHLLNVVANIPYQTEIICINDGSTDNTLALLFFQQQNCGIATVQIKILDLSRNFGKEAALTAGIDYASGDAIIPIDTDLQDPPELIPEMLGKWQQGYDIILATRTDRSSDSWLKRNTACWFYKVHNQISNPGLPENTGDFRLLDRRVVDALKQLPENQRIMKGLFNWVGFKTTQISYVRIARIAGKTKFSSWRLWTLALDGITSFSTVPLRVWTYLGLFISMSAFFYGNFIIFRTLLLGIDSPGYASLIVTILFLGGLQLIGIGVLGEYIGRIYMEAKHRPIYLIREKYEKQMKKIKYEASAPLLR
ncbi:MAG TPA: glycosyltransferase family 2 protein [Methylobacter sp.]|jgi:glycosyltransferase involved in cell wall biosynthesis